MAVPKKKRSVSRVKIRQSSLFLKNFKLKNSSFFFISLVFFLNKKLY